MELRDYISMLARWSWLLALGLGIAMGASYLALRNHSPWPPYQATVTVMIGDESLSFESVQAIRSTYAELAERSLVTQPVIDTLQLSLSARELADQITTNPIGYTRLLEISVVDSEAERSAAIANMLAQQLSQITPSGQRDLTNDTFVHIITAAQVPPRPDTGAYISILVAGITGLILTTGSVLLIEYFDDTIRAPRDVARRLTLPVVGVIKRAKRRKFWRRGVHEEDPLPPSVREAYQWLYVNMCRGKADPPRKLLFTSLRPLEERTTLWSEIASAWADLGHRIVLVDTRVRNAPVHQRFGPSSNGRLESWPAHIVGSASQLDAIAVHTSTYTAPLASNTAVVEQAPPINATDASALLIDVADQADLVVVVGPSVLPAPDVAILSAQVDAVFLLVEAGRVRASAVQAADQALTRAGGNVQGVVLLYA